MYIYNICFCICVYVGVYVKIEVLKGKKMREEGKRIGYWIVGMLDYKIKMSGSFFFSINI